MSRWILSTLVVLFYFSVEAAQIFVDFAAGSDAANGTSTSTPFKRSPGDPLATGTAASTTLAAGDTVFFKGGVSYRLTPPSGNITLNWSGDFGNPITYDLSGAAWGTGYAVITDTNSPASASAAFYSAVIRSNLVFVGGSISNIGGAPSLPTDTGSAVSPNDGNGILLLGGARNVSISNMNFYGLGYWFDSKPMNEACINSVAVLVQGTYNNLLFENLNISHVAKGISLTTGTTGSNVVIRGCTFSYVQRWTIPIASSASNVGRDGHYIQNCIFTNLGPVSGDWTGYGEGPHVDGIISYGSGDYINELVGPDFLHISGCTFSANRVINNGTAPIFLASAPWAKIYNNVFFNSAMGNGCISLLDGSSDHAERNQVYIVNNTFVTDDSLQIYALTETGWPIAHNVWIRNNIVASFLPNAGTRLFSIGNGPGDLNSLYGPPYTFFKTNWIHDHNLYLNTATTTPLSWIGNIQYSVLINNNWGVGLLTNNPMLVAHGSIDGLRLTSASPALMAGTNLSSLFTTDKDGTARPGSAPWSMGAYQESAAITNANAIFAGKFVLGGRFVMP